MLGWCLCGMPLVKGVAVNLFISQLVMGRIGLEHAQSVGWARDLTEAQQRAVGVTVLFHRRTRRDGVTLSNGRDK